MSKSVEQATGKPSATELDGLSEIFLRQQSRVVARIAAGDALQDTLDEIVAGVEKQLPGSRCSVLLLDKSRSRLNLASARSLPASYNKVCDGLKIGPIAGSCGTAAFKCEPVFVADIATDPKWVDFRDAALPFGLRSCWSIPIVSSRTAPSNLPKVLGTFAIYSDKVGLPDERAIKLLTHTEQIARLAIELDRYVRDLRESEARFRLFVDQSEDALFLLDPSCCVLDANARACESLGYSREELIGMSPNQFDADITLETYEQIRAKVAAGETVAFESHHRRKDGTTFPVEIRTKRFADDEREMSISFVRDLTNQRRTENALFESERRFQDLANAIPQIVWIANQDGKIIDGNRLALELLGDAARGDWLQVIHPDDRATVENRWTQAIKTGRPYQCEMRICLATTGEYRWFLARAIPNRHPDREQSMWYGVATDIDDIKRTSETLRQREEQFRAFFETSNAGMKEINANGELTRVNDAYCQMLGYSRMELLKMSLADLVPPDDHDILRGQIARLASGEVSEYRTERRYVRRDGSIGVFQVHDAVARRDGGRPTVIAGVVIDITTRRRLEEQVRQVQKMEAIGRLAGGVAHDFNNVLTIIIGYCELILGDLDPDHALFPSIAAIRDAGDRATRLTRQLLSFSRKAFVETRVFELNQLITSSETLLRRIIGEDILLTVRLDPNTVFVCADPSQLEQVIMNLVINARDAMPTGGTLTIATRIIDYDEIEAGCRPYVLPGKYVELIVEDSGVGMSDEVRGKIFEPFFTTKELGHGTGLGLAVVHGVVNQCRGCIHVESEPGIGSTFIICIPLSESPKSADVGAPGPFGNGQGATILLVEDEDSVRRIIKTELESRGYRVLPTDCGDQAIQVLRENLDAIDLLLTDVVMPGMSGRQVAEMARKFRPDLRVLFMTGYTDDAILHYGVSDALDALIQKPFTPSMLDQKIREVMA